MDKIDNELENAYRNALNYYHCDKYIDNLCKYIAETYKRALQGDKQAIKYFYDIWGDE